MSNSHDEHQKIQSRIEEVAEHVSGIERKLDSHIDETHAFVVNRDEIEGADRSLAEMVSRYAAEHKQDTQGLRERQNEIYERVERVINVLDGEPAMKLDGKLVRHGGLLETVDRLSRAVEGLSSGKNKIPVRLPKSVMIPAILVGLWVTIILIIMVINAATGAEIPLPDPPSL